MKIDTNKSTKVEHSPSDSPDDAQAFRKRLAEAERIALKIGFYTAVAVYLFYSRLDYQQKWVEYTIFPAICLSGCIAYRVVLELKMGMSGR